MPSTTFFNLPDGKRERLLAAARAEFARVPYEDASVNRIIQAAGIPRGSFYMYFTDKEDLFRYLMENYGGMLENRLGQLLDHTGGDLFAAFFALFDDIRAQWDSGVCREMAAIIRRNRQMQPGAYLDRRGPEGILDRLRDKVALDRLDLRTDTDLCDLFRLLVFGLVGALISAGATGDPAAARLRLERLFGILQRGALSKAPCC